MPASTDHDEKERQQAVCPTCHGAGTVLMSLCCGRGCATCPGDGMFENVQCHRCHGVGHLD